MDIEKAKLPKGMSYPLKSSVLMKAFAEADIQIESQLLYSPHHKYFESFFWPPNYNVSHERLYIRTGAVSVAKAYEARVKMEIEVIPQFVAWVEALLTLPLRSPLRLQEQYFSADLC